MAPKGAQAAHQSGSQPMAQGAAGLASRSAGTGGLPSRPNGAPDTPAKLPSATEHHPDIVAKCAILRSQSAPFDDWLKAAIKFYHEGRKDYFEQLMAAAVDTKYRGITVPQEDFVSMHCVIAGAHMERARRNINRTKQRDEVMQDLKNALESLDMAERESNYGAPGRVITGRGFKSLLANLAQSDQCELERSELMFKTALEIRPVNGEAQLTEPKALLGQAAVCFHKGAFLEALAVYRRLITGLSGREDVSPTCMTNLYLACALCFSALGRFDKVRASLDRVISVDSSNVEAIAALAFLEGKSGTPEGVDRSVELLESGLKVAPESVVVLLHLANHTFYTGCGQKVNGVGNEAWLLVDKLLRKVLRLAKTGQVRGEAHYQLGRLNHAKDHYETASDHYTKCLSYQPRHVACLFGLAQTHLEQDNLQMAEESLESIREQPKHESNFDVLKLLAYVYLKMKGKPKQAITALDKCIAQNKDDLDVWAMKADAQEQLSVLEPEVAELKKELEAYEQVARIVVGAEASGELSAEAVPPQTWNNLGTLRSLQGDTDGAKEAYGKALKLIEDRMTSGTLDGQETKKMAVAQVVVRYNNAWVTESGETPDFMQATLDYVSLSEEHHWFGDVKIRLGALWLKQGRLTEASGYYDSAMSSRPVLACLLKSEILWQLSKNKTDEMESKQKREEAIKAAEKAFRSCRSGEKHYLLCRLGNMYYELAYMLQKDRAEADNWLCKALWSYTRALEKAKDSQYAANGIGMVFALRGKLRFAKRVFQSVLEHHGMAADPSVHINMGHICVLEDLTEQKKAISYYVTAQKLRPKDLRIRMHLARAYFILKQFTQCIGVLSDARKEWPEDLNLNYNFALASEFYGSHLVANESSDKKINRGTNKGAEMLMQAMDHMSNASRAYDEIEDRWSKVSEPEKAAMKRSSVVNHEFVEQMGSGMALHKEFCAEVIMKATKILADVVASQESFEEKVKKVQAQKTLEVQNRQRDQETRDEAQHEARIETEESALRLMMTTKDIDLPQNIEETTKGAASAPRQPKGSKVNRPAGQEGEEGEVSQQGFPTKKKAKREPGQKKEKRRRKRRRGGGDEDGEGGEGGEGEHRRKKRRRRHRDSDELFVPAGGAAAAEGGGGAPGAEGGEGAVASGDAPQGEGGERSHRRHRHGEGKRRKRRRSRGDGGAEDGAAGDEGPNGDVQGSEDVGQPAGEQGGAQDSD